MRHLNGGQLTNMDGRNHFFFLIVLIFQLHNAPDATAEQTVIFGGIVLRNGDVFNAEIGKLGFVAIPPNIQVDRDLINDGKATALPQHREDLLRFIGTHVVFGKDLLNVFDAACYDLRVIGAAILP